MQLLRKTAPASVWSRAALSVLGLCALALTAVPARATTDFTFTLTNPNQFAGPGATVLYDGTLTFTQKPTDSYFYGSLSSPNVPLTENFTPSFLNFFTSGLPGGTLSYTGSILSLTSSPTSPNGGVVNGSLTMADTTGSLAQPFSLTIVPEPSSLAVFALAGAGLLGLTLRARKARVA